MSNQYKHYGDVVPSEILCARLRELSDAVTEGPESVAREFTMRIPAELDRDADLVLSQAAIRIAELESALASREGEAVACSQYRRDEPCPNPESCRDNGCSAVERKEFTHPQAAVPDDMRAMLFSGWKGCSNHGCVVTGPKKGMGTNGMCQCLVGASRWQLQMLQGRLSSLLTTHKERTE